MNKQTLLLIPLLLVGMTAATACFSESDLISDTLTNSYYFYGYQFSLAAGASCTHDAYFNFELYWSNDTDYTTGTSSDATVTYDEYSGVGFTDATCDNGTISTGNSYYAYADTTTGSTATGGLTTQNDVTGDYSMPCGYGLTITAGSADAYFEYDTNNAMGNMLSGVLAASAVVSYLLF